MLAILKSLFSRPESKAKTAPSAASQAVYDRGKASQQQGDLEGAISDFRRAIELDPENRLAYRDLCLALVQQGDPVQARRVILRGLSVAPLFPDFHYYLGNLYSLDNDYEKAIASYQKALALKPDFAEVRFNLGILRRKSGEFERAEAGYRDALTIHPDDAEVLNKLGETLDNLGKYPEAADCYRKSVALDPDNAVANYNLGAAAFREAAFEEALACLRKSVALNPALYKAKFSLGNLLLLLGQFEEAWDAYESRWQRDDFVARSFSRPRWSGATGISGKTLLLHAEQGLGDTLQFVRYVDKLSALGARVILEVQEPLKTILQSYPGTSGVFVKGEELPDFDFHCPLMSLPHAFRTDLSGIPAPARYLVAPAERVAHWSQRLGGQPTPHIGLVWSGNPAHGDDHNRSLPLSSLASLWQDGKRSFLCLQKEIREQDRGVLDASPWLIKLSPELMDFAETAAVIENLDLIITVDTSVAHLAGALGKPVWILLPFVPDWRWLLDRSDSPWYPSARLFRQRQPGNWESVIRNLDLALAAEFDA
ncbi:MAG: tetratricopeptide repeat protein [Rhodocyclaceae bacterium]|nr:tetratricopeptide repeat protein [Rhodocyclaceae bacterium]